MSHAALFFDEVAQIVRDIDRDAIDRLASELAAVRERRGRLFLLGVGGSAGNCSHAVNDFRKLCGIEAYTPVDNVSELTARTNDEGWDTVFEGWLEVSNANEKDAILIFSVGGGDAEKNVSPNLVKAIDFAKKRAMKVYGIVGRATGYTAKRGDVVVVIPAPNASHITPHSEAFQAVVWHCLVSNPVLQRRATKWGECHRHERSFTVTAMAPRRAVFFDRDGTLNEAVVRDGHPYPPAGLADMILMPGAVEALQRLKAAGLFLAMATNQPDAAKGLTSRAAIESMNDWLVAQLPIDHVEVCWCLEGPDCKCYKPLPGMLFDAAARHNIRLDQSFMVGDRWRDIGAGKAAGCYTIWLRNDYDVPREQPDRSVRSLAEAADVILQQCR